MRADRLLSILMLLQARGVLTARVLAAELEVSERTIYRDVEALSMAGVPVLAERGPGGGIALLDSYRTTLTGLTEPEIRALFMLSTPAPLADLGMTDDLRAALRKLAAALPAAGSAESARHRIYLDSTPWRNAPEPAPSLHALHRAVWDDQQMVVRVRLPFDAVAERLIDPLGLVAKSSEWYLVYRRDERILVLRLADVLAVSPGGGVFVRPPDFDLPAFWQAHCQRVEQGRTVFTATVRAAPALFAPPSRVSLPYEIAAPPGADGWVILRVAFISFEDARRWVLGCGRAVEVLEPPALRASVIDHARQVLAVYRSAADG